MDEEIYYNVPNVVANSLRCNICKLYLSCKPIKRDKVTNNYICGRCPYPMDAISETLYEESIKNYAFPCCFDYKGCSQRLLFDNVAEHESNCIYRTFQCPTASETGCLELLSPKSTKDHFLLNHPTLIMKNHIKLELHNNNVQSAMLIIANDTIVVFHYFYDASKNLLIIETGFIFKNDMDALRYKIQIKDESGKSIDFKWNECKPYKSSMDEKNEIILDKFLPVFENPSAIGFKVLIDINKLSINAIDQIHCVLPSKYVDYNKEDEEKFVLLQSKLSDIICYICADLILPPVYKSTYSDALFCLNCAASNQCQYIDKIIENYPCKWKGCAFVGNQDNIRTHVENCKFIKHICLFCHPENQFLMTLNNMMEHLQSHAEYLPDAKNISINMFNSCNTMETRNYFTVFENKIAYFIIKLLTEKNWSFMCKSNENIHFNVSFEHDHCRFKTSSYLYTTNCFTIERNQLINVPKCFSLYNCLTINLSAANFTIPMDFELPSETKLPVFRNKPFIQIGSTIGQEDIPPPVTFVPGIEQSIQVKRTNELKSRGFTYNQPFSFGKK